MKTTKKRLKTSRFFRFCRIDEVFTRKKRHDIIQKNFRRESRGFMTETFRLMNMLVEAVLTECRLLACVFTSLMSCLSNLTVGIENDSLLSLDSLITAAITAVIIIAIIGSLSRDDLHNQVRKTYAVYSGSGSL